MLCILARMWYKKTVYRLNQHLAVGELCHTCENLQSHLFFSLLTLMGQIFQSTCKKTQNQCPHPRENKLGVIRKIRMQKELNSYAFGFGAAKISLLARALLGLEGVFPVVLYGEPPLLLLVLLLLLLLMAVLESFREVGWSVRLAKTLLFTSFNLGLALSSAWLLAILFITASHFPTCLFLACAFVSLLFSWFSIASTGGGVLLISAFTWNHHTKNYYVYHVKLIFGVTCRWCLDVDLT